MIWKFAAISCSHSPFTSRERMQWAVKQIEAHKPDVIIHLGDGLDADAASKYPSEYGHTILDEFRHLESEVLAPLALIGATKLVYLEGNHEYNLVDNPGRIDPKLKPVIRERWRQTTDGWHVVPYCATQRWCIGQVTFRHGAKCGVNADRQEALLYGVENGLHVMGHTHRPRPVTRIELPGAIPMAYWYANPGYLAERSAMMYTHRINTEGWGFGVVIGEAHTTGEGRRRYASRRWDAELILGGIEADHRG